MDAFSIINTPGQISTELCDQQQLNKDSEEVRNLFSSLPIVPTLFKTLLNGCFIRFLGVKGAQRGKISHVWAGTFGLNWKG